MVRIKTVTSAGIIFLSPFVYTLEEAEEKIESLLSWHDTPEYHTVEVKKYPAVTRYDPQKFLGSGVRRKIEIAGRAWGE